MIKLVQPKFDILEEMALKFAMTYYEAARSQGIKPRNPKHKTARLWALSNFQKFIPKALEIATDMLGRTDIAEPVKEKIYMAIMERNNDPVYHDTFKTLPPVNIEKIFKEVEMPKPVVVNTKKVPTKQRLLGSANEY